MDYKAYKKFYGYIEEPNEEWTEDGDLICRTIVCSDGSKRFDYFPINLDLALGKYQAQRECGDELEVRHFLTLEQLGELVDHSGDRPYEVGKEYWKYRC